MPYPHRRKTFQETAKGRQPSYQTVFDRLPEGERRRVIEGIVAEIRAKGDADTDPSRPISEWELHLAAARLVVKLAEDMTNDGGHTGAYYAEEEVAALMPAIVLQRGLSAYPKRYRRVVSHELAHHLQHTWVAPNLYDSDEVVCTGQDNQQARHEIARAVEDLIT